MELTLTGPHLQVSTRHPITPNWVANALTTLNLDCPASDDRPPPSVTSEAGFIPVFIGF